MMVSCSEWSGVHREVVGTEARKEWKAAERIRDKEPT